MRTAVFSSKPYDREFLESANARAGTKHELSFLEARLSLETASLAAEHVAVCAFVNDHLDATVLQGLAAVGVRLVALRSAGFNHVDLVSRAPNSVSPSAVSPPTRRIAVAEHTVGADAGAQPQDPPRLRPGARGQLRARRAAGLRPARPHGRHQSAPARSACASRGSCPASAAGAGLRPGARIRRIALGVPLRPTCRALAHVATSSRLHCPLTRRRPTT